jgi:hypothetical protein
MMFNFTLLSMVTVLFGNIATMILHFLYVFYDLLMDSGQWCVWLNSNGPWCSGFVSTANREPVARFLSFSMAPAEKCVGRLVTERHTCSMFLRLISLSTPFPPPSSLPATRRPCPRSSRRHTSFNLVGEGERRRYLRLESYVCLALILDRFHLLPRSSVFLLKFMSREMRPQHSRTFYVCMMINEIGATIGCQKFPIFAAILHQKRPSGRPIRSTGSATHFATVV